MKGIACSYFWWPGLDRSIERLAKSCLECQAVKKAPASAPLHPWSWPTGVFQRIHIDYAGPFQGAKFLVHTPVAGGVYDAEYDCEQNC